MGTEIRTKPNPFHPNDQSLPQAMEESAFFGGSSNNDNDHDNDINMNSNSISLPIQTPIINPTQIPSAYSGGYPNQQYYAAYMQQQHRMQQEQMDSSKGKSSQSRMNTDNIK